MVRTQYESAFADPDLDAFADQFDTRVAMPWICNTTCAGHSRAVLARDSGAGAVAVQLTFDAKPEHPEEMARIQARTAATCRCHVISCWPLNL